MKQITNCGLIALRNISTLENISIRTMLHIAEDNGLKLYPYKVPVSKVKTVPLPAIFHAENHFVYVTDSSELKGYKLTGNVLLTNKTDNYNEIPTKLLTETRGCTWAAIVVGVASIGYGAYSKGRANKKTKDALKNRKAYQTPDEVYQILNALENRSQGDVQTRDFQTQQIDNAFSQQLGVAELLGADTNDLSGLFQQKMNGILQVGQQFHASNMEAFGKYLGGLDMVAQNKAAEQGSQQNIVKDQLQAAAADGAAANATINSGINTVLAGYSSYQQGQLYKEYLKTQKTGFDNSTIKDAISPVSAQAIGYAAQPQRTVGTGTQTIVQNNNAGGIGNNFAQDAGFLQWLNNGGIGTKR